MSHVANTLGSTYHKVKIAGVKKKLQEYRWIVENVNLLEDQLLEAETDIQRMTQIFNDMPSATGFHDKYTLKIARMIEIKKEINEELERKAHKLEEVHEMIKCLDERDQLLIRYRYIRGLTWPKCAVCMNYDWRQLHNIHNKILNKIVKDTVNK